MKWRIISLIFIFGFLYFFIIFRLYGIQIDKRDIALSKVAIQQQGAGAMEPIRGNIYFIDKNNNKIAAVLNKEYSIVFAVPKEIQKNTAKQRIAIRTYAENLNPIINLSIEELEKKLNKSNDEYELLAQKITEEQVARIKDLNLTGIYVKDEPLRFYSLDDLAAHLLGFTAPNNENGKFIGRYGTEKQFEDLLKGKPGKVDGTQIIQPEPGKNINLTIDRNIQGEAEAILKKLIKQYQAAGGVVIVQEPKTGKILAMGGSPNFNPNDYSQFGVERYLNPVVQKIYEPGSIFKLITMAAGLDAKKITPETAYTDTGSITLNKKTIKNWDDKIYGKQTMKNVLEISINTGAVFAQQKTGPDIFYNYLVKFGFNETTKIDLPGEIKNNITTLKNGREINFATASFGQGVAVTPIAMLNAVSAIANDGVLMRPYVSADKNPETVRRIISSETARTLTQMMISVVEVNKSAVISGYSIAGKTGTALIPDFEKGGYTDQVMNTFMGFAPAFDPKFTVLIRLDKPVGAPYAGASVAPAFRELAQFILNYYNIAPDALATNH